MSGSKRIDGIDFWRGIVLAMIFINHVPGNGFEIMTHRHVGFSDSAEAFVFLAGVSVALAYGGRFLGNQSWRGLRAIVSRAVTLYGVQIAMSFMAIAIFAIGALIFDDDTIMHEHGRDLFLSNPMRAVVAVTGLSHQLGYFNILPMYIVFLLWAPALLLLARVDDRLMLGSAALIYLFAREYGWNFPTWPVDGGWFFNPFTWQFLFAAGVFIGLRLRQGEDISFDRRIFAASVVILAASAFVITKAFGFLPLLPEQLNSVVDMSKTNLAPIRMIHFLALAYVLYHSGLTLMAKSGSLFAPLCVIGRQSLPVFAAGSILSAIGQIVIGMRNTGFIDDLLFIGGGLLLLYAIALYLSDRRDVATGEPPKAKIA
ncbi:MULTISPECIES: OpgC domain-containing protein [unclassified Chelatococcus]|uniref:OpgC family protein n=1 Tax=unclassified Chelatococcus TaxID=2638111 RepID=UPI001BD121F5|nr:MULTISPECIES: OpgC domain-containing protein [unclassified Chelatococcus]MBS7696764.1 OpgC domain-containing protein [Chelatococcus sp. YT9]MBX3555329.1 OpgC domain-containing protein [Chelatococcus sp.]